MSLNHSTAIVTSGLIFYYDMLNTKKSWLGRPYTNQFVIPTADSNGFSVQNDTFYRIRTGTYGGYDIKPTDYVWKYNINGNSCPYHGNDVSITAGYTATFTFDFYVSPSTIGYPSTNFLANFEGVTGGSVGDPSPSIVGVWKTVSFTATASSTGNCRMLLYPGACGAQLATGTGFILYKNPRVEFNAPGSSSVPFVKGTRYANPNLESTPNYPTWNQGSSSSSGGTLTFTSGSYNSKAYWDLYKTYSGLSTATNYTWSALVKLGTATNFIVTMNNTQAWNTGPSAVFSTELSTQEYRRVSITGTTSSGSFNLHLGASNNTEVTAVSQSGGTVYLQDVRLQPTTSEPALVDLTGKNSLAINSLTYNSDGTFYFNGSSDYITSNSTLIDRTNGQEITVSCWIKTETMTGKYRVFCNNRSNGGTYNWIFYQHATDGAISFHGSNQNKSSYIPTPNTWIHVTNTVTSSGVSTLYINGVSTYTVTGYTYGSVAGTLGIGGWPGGTNEYYQGQISAVQIYDRALSDSEIKQNFQATRKGYGV